MVWLTGSSFASCSMVGWSSWLTVHLQSSLEINPYYRQPSRLPTRAQALWAFKYELTTEPPLRVPLAAQPGSSSRGAFLSNFRLRANFFFFRRLHWAACGFRLLATLEPWPAHALLTKQAVRPVLFCTTTAERPPSDFPRCFHHRVTSACATNKVHFSQVASCSYIGRCG